MTTHDDAPGLDAVAVIAIQVVVAVTVWGGAGLLVDLLVGTGPWVQFIGVGFGTMISLVLAQRYARTPTSDEAPDG